MISPVVQAMKSECYNGLITIEVEAPNEVKPEEEFLIFFKIYALSNVLISYVRVELWGKEGGNYTDITLLKNLHLSAMGVIRRNITFVLQPALPYPNIVICDLWILCREEGGEDQFSHFRTPISWCISPTYRELEDEYENLQSTYNDYVLTHSRSNTEYTSLQESFNSLNSTYYGYMQNHSYTNLEYNGICNDLNLYKYSTYGLVISTLAFIATTIYFAKRKPKL